MTEKYEVIFEESPPFFADYAELQSFLVRAGKDGITPHIGQDGYWYLGDTSTGVKALGINGADGQNGKSAYELYAEHGGALSEMQWLASLAQTEPPISVVSLDEMTNQSKLYVLGSEGYIYAYGERSVTVKYNAYDPQTAQFNKRINSSGAEATLNGALLLPYEELDMVDPYVVKISGITLVTNYSALVVLDYYDSDKSKIAQVNLSASTGLAPVGGVYSFDLFSPLGTTTYADAKYVRIKLGIAASGTAVSAADCEELVVEFVPKSGTKLETRWHNTGLAYVPADYEDRIIELEEQASDYEQRIRSLEDGSSGSSYPAYWQDALDECIAKIKALQAGRGCVTFPFFSDNHQRLGYSGVLIAAVMKECGIPYCFFGGDAISNGYIESESAMVSEARAFDAIMKAIPSGRFCRTVGNHDGYWAVSASESHTYTRDQVYELFLRGDAVAQNRHFGADGTYYYVDDKASKVRFIVLNSNGGFGEEQRAWVQNTALCFGENGWSVVFISHAPVTNNKHSYINDAQAMQTLLTDYIGGTDESKASVVGWFSGHIHRDRIYQCDHTGNYDLDDQETVTLPWKTVTVSSDHTGISYDDATKHTVASDDQSHAIDFVTVNTASRTVSITRLGIGSDRSYTY